MYMHANSELCFLGDHFQLRAIFTTAGQSFLCRLKLNSATARVSDFFKVIFGQIFLWHRGTVYIRLWMNRQISLKGYIHCCFLSFKWHVMTIRKYRSSQDLL